MDTVIFPTSTAPIRPNAPAAHPVNSTTAHRSSPKKTAGPVTSSTSERTDSASKHEVFFFYTQKALQITIYHIISSSRRSLTIHWLATIRSELTFLFEFASLGLTILHVSKSIVVSVAFNCDWFCAYFAMFRVSCPLLVILFISFSCTSYPQYTKRNVGKYFPLPVL